MGLLRFGLFLLIPHVGRSKLGFLPEFFGGSVGNFFCFFADLIEGPAIFGVSLRIQVQYWSLVEAILGGFIWI